MARENIDHTFKLKHQKLKYNSGWWNWEAEGRGIKATFCRGSMNRQFGEPPKGTKTLFLRVSTRKPKDKEVQWWQISVKAGRKGYTWSPSPDNKNPRCELLGPTTRWGRENLKLKDGQVIKLWAGCWVEE